jgi:hypothetical protein
MADDDLLGAWGTSTPQSPAGTDLLGEWPSGSADPFEAAGFKVPKKKRGASDPSQDIFEAAGFRVPKKPDITFDSGTVPKQPLPASMQPAPEAPPTAAEAALAAQRGVPAQVVGGVPLAGPGVNWALAAASAARPRLGESGSFMERFGQRLEEQRRADAFWAAQNPATATALRAEPRCCLSPALGCHSALARQSVAGCTAARWVVRR